MKNVIVIIGGSIASFLLLLLLGLGLLSMKPELFTGHNAADQQSSAANKHRADSLKAAQSDSLLTAATDSTGSSGQTAKDTTFAAKLMEKSRSHDIQVDPVKTNAIVNPSQQPADTVGRPDWKSTAKLIEAMSVEEATKILKQMSDQEVKQILAKLKKRQAGKILAIFEPDRAVKILR